eukprot:2411385-Amphidinium_carterae.1
MDGNSLCRCDNMTCSASKYLSKKRTSHETHEHGAGSENVILQDTCPHCMYGVQALRRRIDLAICEP